MMFRTVFEPLVLVKASGGYQPFLAASMTVKGRRITLKLRPGITFHDGRPFTSADVKYTLDAFSKRGSGTLDMLRLELRDLAEVYAPTPQTVVLVLRRPNHLFPSLLSEIGILPAHLYKRRGLRNPRLNKAPVGTGPFLVEGRTANRALSLRRNDEYWGQPARLTGVKFIAIPDPAQALASLRNGELEIIPSLHQSYYPAQVKTPRMTSRFRILRIHPYRMKVMVYNLRRGPLRDRRVRLALAHLTDRQRLVRMARNNLGQVLSAPIWSLSPGYDKMLHPSDYDRKRAGRLLDSAGWRDARARGRRRRLGHALSLKILVARKSRPIARGAAMLKAELIAAGISAQVQAADFGFLKAQLKRGRFDIAMIGLALRPGADLTPFLHSKGALNVGRYSNPAVDRLLVQLRATASASHRHRSIRRLHRILRDDPPMTVLYSPIDLMMVRKTVRGLANNGRWPQLATLSMDAE